MSRRSGTTIRRAHQYQTRVLVPRVVWSGRHLDVRERSQIADLLRLGFSLPPPRSSSGCWVGKSGVEPACVLAVTEEQRHVRGADATSPYLLQHADRPRVSLRGSWRPRESWSLTGRRCR